VIVCSCNVLSDHAIRRSIGEGAECAGRVSDVFDCFGCRPQCGRCAPTIRRLIREHVSDGAVTCPAVLDDIGAGDGPVLLAAE